MRTFVKLREAISTNTELKNKLNFLEAKYDDQFRAVFDAIRALMTPPDTIQRSIGFKSDESA